jgi:hypothetical protein
MIRLLSRVPSLSIRMARSILLASFTGSPWLCCTKIVTRADVGGGTTRLVPYPLCPPFLSSLSLTFPFYFYSLIPSSLSLFLLSLHPNANWPGQLDLQPLSFPLSLFYYPMFFFIPIEVRFLFSSSWPQCHAWIFNEDSLPPTIHPLYVWAKKAKEATRVRAATNKFQLNCFVVGSEQKTDT